VRAGLRQLVAALAALGGAGCAHSVEVFELTEGGVAPEDAGAQEPGDAQSDAHEPPDARPPADAQPPDAALGSGSGRIVAAFEHTCVVDDAGLFCWGRNADGQLGLGNSSPALSRPQRIERAGDYSELCTGETHTWGLCAEGALECWGGNEQGQLGLGDMASRSEPTPTAAGLAFSSIACGGNITCGVAAAGALYCWGDNAEGQLGLGDSDAVMREIAVPTRVPLALPARQVSVGQGHVCAVVEGGALYCWGRNSQAQLGIGSGRGQVRSPTLVNGGGSYLQVTAALAHTCGVRVDGRLFCWGLDLDGRLGLGTTEEEVAQPAQVGSAGDYLQVQANWFHTCALREGGRLECWGRNVEGQLGLGDWMSRAAPETVASSVPWSALAVGRFHTCAIRAGAVYCWGKNEADQFQLGLGDHERRNLPAWVSLTP
jgi:alpha-tubulin suppressor-like RCC1 family protein